MSDHQAICEHGGLKRKCEICNLLEEVHNLRAELAYSLNDITVLKKERDEAREDLESWKKQCEQRCKDIDRVTKQRDEAREALKECMEEGRKSNWDCFLPQWIKWSKIARLEEKK